jgi:predicted AlkP superfamily phosphohydrolase/phosphomutase
MEDTWGRNEHALDDQGFLDQAYLTHDERRTMFLDALDRTKEGLCACVFDASDRIQHMFWRYLEEGHPAPLEDKGKFAGTISEMYQKMDQLVGEVRARIKLGDVLIVLSDHGFTSFKRCINLNTWLYRHGYLALKESGDPEADYFRDVDWSKTKAFAVGLTGLYINRKGRERWGIVEEKEAEKLKRELMVKLKALCDPQTNKPAIRNVYDSAQVYRGVYRDDAPDLIVGSEPGYRVSWESVTGGIRADVFEDNIKAWSGDHDVDPSAVPGVLFSNLKLKAQNPRLIDLAPTVLDLFAVPIPSYMEGKPIM